MTESEFLRSYDKNEFEKPSVTADILVFTVKQNNLCILLIKRGGYPFKDKWAIPGGFVRMDETSEDTAIRELKEETGISNAYMEQLYTFSKLDRDPRMRIISIAYFAPMPSNMLSFKSGSDADDAKLFYVKESNGNLVFISEDGIIIEESELAFDHAEIIHVAVDRLRSKIEYSDVIFHFVQDINSFTIPELQMIYNAVSYKTLDNGNFRKWLLSRFLKRGEEQIIPINRKSDGERGRKAMLYKRKI